ncbi:hypothetical protein ACWF9G_33875 [Nocardia sp. NPDC055029]
MEFVYNELVSEDGSLVARPTDRTAELSTSLELRSIGYRGVPITGLPFDERGGVVPNDRGRVLMAGAPMAGLYVSGWIKRGQRGVIGTNRVDAHETVGQVITDYTDGKLAAPQADRAGLKERQPDLVDHAGWQSIDSAERREGQSNGRPRVKYTSHENLLKAAQG